MRFLDANEMLCLLPAEAGVTDQALTRLNPLLARGESKRLPALTEQGSLKTAQINFQGRPAFVLWYRVELDRLIVDTMTAVAAHTTDEFETILGNGVETIARAYGCSSVEGVTARAALARVYMRNGFQARGVVLRKEFAN